MGSVRFLTATGDNDPEIDPVAYYGHYLYCDACGSFELEKWITPGNFMRIYKTQRRLGTAAWISIPMVAVGAWLVREFCPPLLVLLAGVAVIICLLVVREVLGAKIKHLGLRCRQCDATYRNGSPFFLDLDANPRNLTDADVPQISEFRAFVRGKDEPTKP